MKRNKILYLCDRKKCKNCDSECKYTEDIKHAITFERVGNTYFEKINLAYAISSLKFVLDKHEKEVEE